MRDGKEYCQMVGINGSLEINGNFSVDYEIESPSPLSRTFVNTFLNSKQSNLKNRLRPDITYNTIQTIKYILNVISAKVALQDYFVIRP